MPDQEVCLLRWEHLAVNNGFLHLPVRSTWQWVAYKESRNPANVILSSPVITLAHSVFIPNIILKTKNDQLKRDSYNEILTKLLKLNWKPAAFDFADMATTFLRNK